jgi:4-aminobutyrate aminotransferase-like enzyme
VHAVPLTIPAIAIAATTAKKKRESHALSIGQSLCRAVPENLGESIGSLLKDEMMVKKPVRAIVDAIADAAELWSDAAFAPRLRAREAVSARTGYSLPVVDHAFDSLFSSLRRDAIESIVTDELGCLEVLDGFSDRVARPRARALPIGSVCVISSRTTIGVAIVPAVFALCAKCHVSIKDREDRLAADFFATVADELRDPTSIVRAETWKGPEDAMKLAGYEVVVAFGGDEALAAIRTGLDAATRFIPYGPKASAGYVSREALTDDVAAREVARRAARDLVLYDGEGCLSLHALFVERGAAVSVPRFGELLATAIRDAAADFPIGLRDPHATAQLAMIRDLAVFRAASKDRTRSDPALTSLLLVDPPFEEPPLFLPRALAIRSVDGPSDAVTYLQHHGISLEAIAVEHPRPALLEAASMTGASRITSFGQLQRPPLGAFHGGRARISEFVRWIADETCAGELERLTGDVPGPRTAALGKLLNRYESRNVTYLAPDFPVFWETASGATVTDVDGNRFIDCTSAFGVANVGHCNPRVVEAIAGQARRLIHGMGDVHPTALRVRLFERIAQVIPRELRKTILATTGSEAIEAALKTAILASGKARFAAYRNGYHGLSLGALAVAGIERFREPFADALAAAPLMLDFPQAGRIGAREAARDARALLAAHADVAALVIEPIQGRAGCVVPPNGYLRALRAVCDELRIILIFDEIYTGFGRTGSWFALDHEEVVPDILCIGKAMAGGFPISAAIGREEVMDAWPSSTGEALHTSTYLGSPLGCAAALATIAELERLDLPARADQLGARFAPRLESLLSQPSVVEIRGRGLLWGVQMTDARAAAAAVKRALALGVIVLQSGADGETITIAPPLVIGERQLERAIDLLSEAMDRATD